MDTLSYVPPSCPPGTPRTPVQCALKTPPDPEFKSICQPGVQGHQGYAEQPINRCPRNNYTDGVFRCACCGAPLFYAVAKYLSPGDGWPAFHANGTVGKNVCSPGGSETVCSKCGVRGAMWRLERSTRAASRSQGADSRPRIAGCARRRTSATTLARAAGRAPTATASMACACSSPARRRGTSASRPRPRRPPRRRCAVRAVRPR